MKPKSIKFAIIKSARALWKTMPMIFGTILFVSLISTIIPKSFYIKIFSNNIILDSFAGSLVGSVSIGTPIISYILGGQMLEQGVSLIATTAFLVAWVTVGVMQLPVESVVLGKRFTFLRNFSAFILAIIVAILTVLILKII